MTRPAAAVLAAIVLAGCAVASSHPAPSGGPLTRSEPTHRSARSGGLVLHGDPRAVDPVAGTAASAGATGDSGPSSVSVGPATGGGSGTSLAEPVSLTDVRRQLTESGVSADPNRATLTPGGLAIPPVNAPAVVQEIIAAANQIAHLPYIWGGGHATYEDTGYDCSGSLSFILAAAGLLKGTETSGEFMHYGDPGLGKWITIFAMNGHTFAYIAGLRFDTVAYAETGTRWSNRRADESNLSAFVARHPPGL